MSEPVTPITEPAQPPAAPAATAPAAPTEGDKPLGENGEKALKAERDARAAAEKNAAALQKQLDDIAAANLSDLEKAQKALSDAQAEAAKAASEALRLRIAAKHGISDEDADLFLTGSDAETVERQASALAARTTNGPKPDLTQGTKGAPATGDPVSDFTNLLNSLPG